MANEEITTEQQPCGREGCDNIIKRGGGYWTWFFDPGTDVYRERFRTCETCSKEIEEFARITTKGKLLESVACVPDSQDEQS